MAQLTKTNSAGSGNKTTFQVSGEEWVNRAHFAFNAANELLKVKY